MNHPFDNQLVDALDADAAAAAETEARAQALLQEEADVGAWQKRIDEAREFDKEARKGYAIDRMYCANDIDHQVYDVSVPIAGTYVNLLTSFLFARDPEPSVLPAESVGSSRVQQAKLAGRTLEIVITSLWKKGRLKGAADQMVRSGLTIGPGWIKAAWHRQTDRDPIMSQQIDDLRTQIQAAQESERQLMAGDAPNPDELRAQYERQMASLEQQVEVVIYNGLCIDFVRGDDMQVAPAVPCLKDYLSAPWIAHRSFMTMDEAKAAYPDVVDEDGTTVLSKATQFFQAKASDNTAARTPTSDSVSDTDADSFRSGSAPGITESSNAHLCIWELWDKRTGTVITFAAGLKRYLRPAYQPDQKTTRFYAFFLWAPLWVDGRRHPQSLISRSRALLDEYNRIRTNYREHRRRAIPKLGFDAGAVEPDEARKMEAGAIGEMVGLNLNGQTSTQVLFPIQYNQIDPALYDTAVIRSELELIWGIQEALSSSIQTAKTATEADIQQQGTESRLGYSRDSLDEVFGELAQYTAEVAMSPAGLTTEEAQQIAGPEALWVQMDEPDMLTALLFVDIRAGSSGRPATNLRRQQWGAILPQLQQAVVQIGQMRGASSLDIANSLEQLMVETIERTGDSSIDAYSFIPQAPQPDPMAALGAPGMPMDPAAIPMPPEAANVPAMPMPAPPAESLTPAA
ncbi:MULTISPECIES: hypothetical protein [Xanthomonas]|uniref:Portal protein n=1 Tax=Xanthomonas dyei TaxID=743699 RepID=A0ABZ0D8N8_9XANT|nr:hypothetical protein [Xanthomonas dyei]WOB24756.1 hypothetical protein NYR99_13200 [Xanthomonas dyei]WOB52384.1 hypothetical protein NYR95_13205 [Xanthomonas dyei]